MEDNNMGDQILELTRQVTILNERLPSHVEWATRNLLDHEKRIRIIEQRVWIYTGIALASGGVGALISKALGA
jgi:hypothetical protein